MKKILTGLLVILVAGCTGSTSIATDAGAPPDSVTPEDAGTDTAPVEDAVVFTDLRAVELDSAIDFGTAGEVDVPEPACETGQGCFGDTCNDNGDCQSGWCVEHMGQKLCSQVCQEECPSGWTCTQVAAGSPDLVYVCVSNHPNLCRPCNQAIDCTGVAGTEDACIAYGHQGSFCGGACTDDKQCPWGFSCKQAETVDDVQLMQCVANTGECPCTDTSILLGLWTACALTNEFGTCTGKRVCTPDGLSECSAKPPQAESCNGEDDDCNGEADEPDLVDGNYVNLCDDANPCTLDKCTGDQGCVNAILDSGTCDDNDPCTVADHCVQGTCLGDPVQCEDENPCTDNVCTATGGCDFPPNSGACNDDNPCTLADTCSQGQCTGTLMPCDCLANDDCAPLEDGNLCNGTLICDTTTLPYQCVVDEQTLIQCPDPEGPHAFCLQSWCQPETGECQEIPHHEGFLCNDSDACTVNSQCTQGECTASQPVNCNDGNLCTDDSCDPEAGCSHTPNQVPCNDADVCSTQDTCLEGQCQGGPALDCDDSNACNGQESCDSQAGCQPGGPLVCDDKNLCNGVETCDSQQGCLPGTPINCEDDNPCTSDSCQPETGCVHDLLSGESCNDGNKCTADDKCHDGFCTGLEPVVCTDDNPCTDNSCDPAVGCLTTVNQALCDDGDICTTGDHCQLGDCIFSGQLPCNDLNSCTDDTCHPESGCQFTPNQTLCEDGNLCTAADTCAGGWCVPGDAVTCSDENECTADSCVAETGCQFDAVADATPCNQNQPRWWCDQGACMCHPDCDGKQCGDDGCGGVCGTCQLPAWCEDGQCITEVLLWEDQFDDGSINPAWWSPGCIKWGSMGGCSTSESGGNLILNATVGSTGNTYGGTAWAQTQTDFRTGDDYRIVFNWDYKVQAASLNCGIIEIADGPVSVNQGGLFDHNIHTETAGRKFLNYQTANLNFQTWSVCIRGTEQTAAIYANADCSGDALKSVDISALPKWYLRYLVCTATSAGFPSNNVTMKLDQATATKL